MSGIPVEIYKTDENGNRRFLSKNFESIKSKCAGNKICVISIIGPYRTGKSFLLDCLLASRLGPSTTLFHSQRGNGVWMWSEPIIIRNKIAVLIMDSPGLFNPMQDEDIGQFVMKLTKMISSVLMVNMFQTNSGFEIKQLMAHDSSLVRGNNVIFILRDFEENENEPPKVDEAYGDLQKMSGAKLFDVKARCIGIPYPGNTVHRKTPNIVDTTDEYNQSVGKLYNVLTNAENMERKLWSADELTSVLLKFSEKLNLTQSERCVPKITSCIPREMRSAQYPKSSSSTWALFSSWRSK